MGEVGVNAAEVRALAQRVLDGADAFDDIGWPADTAEDMAGSAIVAQSSLPWAGASGDAAERYATAVAAARSSARQRH